MSAGPSSRRPPDAHMDASMPVRDHGSFVHGFTLSDADIADHRKQDTVYIGLHVPRRSRHRRRHHRHHKRSPEEKQALKEEFSNAATPPAQRVQFLLGEEDDDPLHQAHDLFCEMAELFTVGEEKVWKETARWIKFEEDVEEGGERWSKPHVATLSLHSLFELRCCLMSGTCILDMDAFTLDQMTDLALDQLIASKQLEDNLRDQVRDTLLARHHHHNEKKHRADNASKIHLPLIRSLADIGKKYSEPKGLSHHGGSESAGNGAEGLSLPMADDRIGAKSTPNMQRLGSLGQGLSHTDTESASLRPSPSFSLGDTEASSHKNLHFMKKIPPGAEASNILVGEVDYLNHQICLFVRLSKAAMLGDLTEVPVPTRFVFVLLGPPGNQNKYHEIGRSIATLMSDEIFHDVAYHARCREDLFAGIDEFLDQVTVLPPGEWDPSIRIEPPKSVPSQESRKTGPTQPNGKAVVEEEMDEHADVTLMRTGRLFGGLRDDCKRKMPWYFSDFKDALHVQAVASFIFLYFACLTPIITFGGLLGDATEDDMAALESILAGAICGITYALLAGQPLTILGSTGPVLVFETILHHFCKDNHLNYLQFRLWIGLWTGVILLVMVALDLSALVRYITRFTEESFAALISLIFIVEAVLKLIKVQESAPVNLVPELTPIYTCFCNITNETSVPIDNTGLYINESSYYSNFSVFENYTGLLNKKACTKTFKGELWGEGCGTPDYVPDVFFFSILLFLATFTLAMTLKMIRNGSFGPTVVRAFVSDFAVLIAILACVLFDFLVGLDTPKLNVPEKFQPTNPKRSWFINPIGENPWWVTIAAIIPALLCTILIFMDQQITAVIVNRKENKLKKGHGYHLDLFVVGLLIIINSFLGLPWFVAATVLSINHVNSLKKESKCSAPGERPKFLGVREQRVTGVIIFLMIGISVLLTSVLKFIPMPVLYGVFLYMGVSSLKGMQLVDRIMIVFMPPKYQPDLMYLRHVRTKRVHLFTAIQVFCLVVLWVIKTIKSISIAFPIMVLAMCFVRKGMDWVFTQRELKWLDDIMPESHRRAKEDAMKGEESEMVDGSTGDMMKLENYSVAADLDSVNISEEMAKTAIWRNLVANESSSNLEEKHRDSKKERKKKHGSKKSREGNGSSIRGAIREEEEEHPVSPSKKKGAPVRFYIDEEGHDGHEGEKEHLITPPEIVVDPPSDTGTPSGSTNRL